MNRHGVEYGETMTLELRNVSKRFPGVLAVDVSFSAPAGEITGYLGYGSGKSTTMK